eukprot:gene28089-49878_t
MLHPDAVDGLPSFCHIDCQYLPAAVRNWERPADALERSMELPRYGTPNIAYVSTWLGAADDHPMWALNLM